MIKILQRYIFLSVFFNTSVFGVQQKEKIEEIEEKESVSELEVDWDLVPNAKNYEVEIKNEKGSIQILKSIKNTTKTTLTCGSYSLRARSFNKRGVPGEWSAYKNFQVPLKPARRIFPENRNQIITDETVKSDVTFIWEQSGKGVRYKFELFNSEKKRIVQRETLNTQITLTLPVGQSYSWRLTSSKKGCVFDLAREEIFTFDLIGKLKTPEISEVSNEIQWTRQNEKMTYDYLLERRSSHYDMTWKYIKSRNNTDSSRFIISKALPLGDYRITVIAKSPLYQNSEPAVYVFSYRHFLSVQNRLEFYGAYMLDREHLTIKSQFLTADFIGYIPNDFIVSGAAFLKNVGLFVEYEQGSKTVIIQNIILGTKTEFALKSAKINYGIKYEYYILDYAIATRVAYTREIRNLFSLVGPTIFTHSENIGTLNLELGPKFYIGTYQFYPFISYNPLVKSSPFALYPYLEYSFGLTIDKNFSDYLSYGATYAYQERSYDYKDDHGGQFNNTLKSNRLGVFAKWIFY